MVDVALPWIGNNEDFPTVGHGGNGGEAVLIGRWKCTKVVSTSNIASRKEMCLRTAFIEQNEATQQAKRKSNNHSLAFVNARQGILNSIMDISKIEAVKIQLEEEPFNLANVLEGVVDLFYHVGLKKEVDVILDLQDGSLTGIRQHAST
ncbi:hypothetical protein L6452_09395 [Arctium lappa]|uniref:Uncharacterized protein n=1 Tax=Arctium lappa TaxID=4217 RepID=A0ACB9DKF6_ARCLA|nr:hypothetical protein L6452_09395 [Arctium lappa]